MGAEFKLIHDVLSVNTAEWHSSISHPTRAPHGAHCGVYSHFVAEINVASEGTLQPLALRGFRAALERWALAEGGWAAREQKWFVILVLGGYRESSLLSYST